MLIENVSVRSVNYVDCISSSQLSRILKYFSIKMRRKREKKIDSKIEFFESRRFRFVTSFRSRFAKGRRDGNFRVCACDHLESIKHVTASKFIYAHRGSNARCPRVFLCSSSRQRSCRQGSRVIIPFT